MENYWKQFTDNTDAGMEEVFFRIRDLYLSLLKHLYNDPKDIPAFRIHFSMEQRTLSEGDIHKYPVMTVFHRGSQTEMKKVRDVAEIENFENSYTWFRNDVFVVFDYRETGISPLQYITAVFCEEVFRNLSERGLAKLRITHMFENIIASGVTQFFFGFYRLDINLLQAIAASTYEGSYIDCKIYFPRFDTPADRRTRRKGLDVAFSDPVAFTPDNLRQIRKLLELSDKNIALSVGENGKIRGITTQDPYPNECVVRIWGGLSWTITYEEDKKLSYYNAAYHFHKTDDGTWHLGEALGSLAGGLDEKQIERLETVIHAAFQQLHGTIILIGDDETVKAESRRLVDARRATGISLTNLYDSLFLVSHLSSIDGAILMNTDCECCCIGAILDGDVVTKGSPARGARYNSTVNYIKRRKEFGQTFTGVVFSEDGIVDAVTDTHVYRLNLRRR